MKRLFLISVLTVTFSFVYGQKSIDALFEKYGSRDGFTTVTINGNLLKLANCFGNDSGNNASTHPKIDFIRILAQENDSMKVENFYDMVIKDININDYEEFMRVRESKQDLRILVRNEGRRFREFLMIAGGDDNALIQIKGDITLEEAKEISGELH